MSTAPRPLREANQVNNQSTTQRQDKQPWVSPKGELTGFVYLTQPDDYQGQKAYKADLLLDPQNPEHADFIAVINDAVETAYNEAVDKLRSKGGKGIAKSKTLLRGTPLHSQYDEEGNETGMLILKTKANYSFEYDGVTKYTRLDYLDAQCKPMDPPPPIYRGAIVRLKGVMVPYHNDAVGNAGISLRLYGCQLLKLQEMQRKQAEGLEFPVEDDGYQYTAQATPASRDGQGLTSTSEEDNDDDYSAAYEDDSVDWGEDD